MRLYSLACFSLFSLCSALSAADYYIKSLPGLTWPDNSLKMHSGHIVLDEEHHGEMFFWHVEQRHLADRQRTVIWLNGGPGCSSMDGLFLEIGPFRAQDEYTLVENEGSWHEFANLLFVDNPLGTGFSFVDTDHYLSELEEMTVQFMSFLDKFFDLFPEYADDDLYVAGESFAGQFIPYIGKALAQRRHLDRGRKYNLKGLLIGNGWIDPMEGYKSYLPMGVESGLLKPGSTQHAEIEKVTQACLKAQEGHDVHIHIPVCEEILAKFLEVTLEKDADGTNQCVNTYDYTLRDTYPSCGMNWPQELIYVQPYLQHPDVLEAIHAKDKIGGWSECNGLVASKFKVRNSPPSSVLFPSLLKEVPILLFSGDKDIICNHLSTENFIAELKWNGDQGFGSAEQQEWLFQDQNIGYYQTARNLTYVLFHNASHMVPYDFSRRSRDMLDRFMGIDVSSIGGEGAESTVGGVKSDAPTSFDEAADEIQHDKDLLAQAKKYQQYYKAGTVALIVVIVAVCGLVWFIWKHKGSIRRKYGFDKLGLQESGASASDTELEELTLHTPLFDADAFDIGSDDENETSRPELSRPSSAPENHVGPSVAKKGKGGRQHRD